MTEIHLVACGADPQHAGELPPIAIRRLPCVIGRAPACDHRLDDPMISRRHCAFTYHAGQVWVEDLSSLNGTRLDGELIVGPRPVADGATLQLAHLTFVVRQESAPAESGEHPDSLAAAGLRGGNQTG
jgi:pSer/pThr/pTyr-binding forkhead associated (FHA) protein